MTQPLVLLDDPARGYAMTLAHGWLAPEAADALLAWLLAHAPFERESPVIFGRAVTVRRASCAYGDEGLRYRYSGLRREALRWPTELERLRDRLREELNAPFGFVLCNHYPDGDAGLGWHADDEPDLARDAPVAALSLGAERDFAVRLREGGPAIHSAPLPHGSLVVMSGSFQRVLHHRVPVRRRCREPRVSLTFRCMREG
ncbi:MAG: alpha-ketoglutarate-dependent dioxygenase AlkB [Deltaproteobacteria bacterium]|nr:alpha-ketoglutarate-dependent dioxygenase AlkB [Deltaproteobacteria bacterium]